jgi:hypothetical protein
MAAVIDLHTGDRVRTLPERDLAPGPVPPRLRVLPGGGQGGRAPLRGPRPVPARRVFLVRRLVVAALAAVLVVLLAQGAGSVLASGAALVSSPPAASGEVYRVRPGDTLWSVAGALAPGMDTRVAVDELSALNGGTALEVGEELRLPASFG